MRVFLTGGTGLIGSHTASLLAGRGHEVVALCRKGSHTLFLEEQGCEVVEGDVRDPPETLARLVQGCTHTVHSAGLVYSGGSWPKIRAVNVEGVHNVLDASARVGVKHAVHLSSVVVYGGSEGPIDETSPTDSDLGATELYARSKRDGEAEARAVEREGLSLTILRPSAVYGERDRLMAVRVSRMVRGPVAFLLGKGDNTLPAVYAGNVADAVLRALEVGRGGGTYDVGMDYPLTQRDLLEGIAQGMGRQPTFVSLPAGLIRVGADVLQVLGVSAPGTEHLPLGRVARLAMGENPFPSKRIRSELDWAPPHRHEDALERTGRWLRDHEPIRRT